jgi:hypothetical protein
MTCATTAGNSLPWSCVNKKHSCWRYTILSKPPTINSTNKGGVATKKEIDLTELHKIDQPVYICASAAESKWLKVEQQWW